MRRLHCCSDGPPLQTRCWIFQAGVGHILCLPSKADFEMFVARVQQPLICVHMSQKLASLTGSAPLQQQALYLA